MDYDGFTITSIRGQKIASDKESEQLDTALGLVTIPLRFENDTYKLLNQLAEYNGISLQHMLRTIIEQKLKL